MEFEHIYEIVNNEELTYDELLFFYKKYLILKFDFFRYPSFQVINFNSNLFHCISISNSN